VEKYRLQTSNDPHQDAMRGQRYHIAISREVRARLVTILQQRRVQERLSLVKRKQLRQLLNLLKMAWDQAQQPINQRERFQVFPT
jgi:hypothetical protein